MTIPDSDKSRRTVRKIAKLAELPYVPSSDVPYAELRHLVRQHKAITRAAVAIDNMSSDKTDRETGAKIACRLPEDVQVDLQETAKRQRQKAAKLETAMGRELRKLPIWNQFLKQAMPAGIITASYLLSEIDITICNKPSQLRRFLGLAVIDGRLERRRKGEKNHYNAELRTRLWLWATAIYKGCFRGGVPVKTGKYVQAWFSWNARNELRERLVRSEQKDQERAVTRNGSRINERAESRDEPELDERLESANGTSRRERVMAPDETKSGQREDQVDETMYLERAERIDDTNCRERELKNDESNTRDRARSGDGSDRKQRKPKTNGWVKSADLLALDLYVMWRTLEGLPVWPTYLEGVVRGAEHKTGNLIPNVPRVLTLEEARSMVGDVAMHPIPSAAE